MSALHASLAAGGVAGLPHSLASSASSAYRINKVFTNGELMNEVGTDLNGPYSTAEVAALLDVSPSTVRRWIKEGFAPEPGWAKSGRRKQREYTDGWLATVRQSLDGGE